VVEGRDSGERPVRGCSHALYNFIQVKRNKGRAKLTQKTHPRRERPYQKFGKIANAGFREKIPPNNSKKEQRGGERGTATRRNSLKKKKKTLRKRKKKLLSCGGYI